MDSLSQRLIFLTLLAWGCLAPSTSQSQDNTNRPQRPGRDPSTWNWVVPEKIPGVLHATLHSESMDREIGFNVYLPPGYENSPDKRFPVVYYLHGASGSERSALELGDLVRRSVDSGKIGEVIYVYPNGGHYGGYRDWPDGRVKAETWIIRELIPHIDRTYRTLSGREGRALCGWSMGGGGSLRFALKYPEMFCAAATLSAALGYQDNPGDGAIDLVTRNVEAVRGRTGFFMVVGEEDRLFQAHKPFLAKLDELKMEYTFKTQPGVGHNLGTMKEHFGQEVVEFLARHYSPAR